MAAISILKWSLRDHCSSSPEQVHGKTGIAPAEQQ